MARFRRLICFCWSFIFVVAVGFPRSSFAGSAIVSTQAGALVACLAQVQALKGPPGNYSDAKCSFVADSQGRLVIGSAQSCPSSTPLQSGGQYDVTAGGTTMGYYWWCMPSSCVAGTHPNGQSPYSFNDPGRTIGAGGLVSLGECCASVELVQSSWSLSDKSDAVTTGDFVLSGGYCYVDNGYGEGSSGGKIPNPGALTPFQYCKPGVTGCYNTFKDAFCAQTQSGEWNCIPRTPTNDQGGCASGATGSECYSKSGNPVPAPPDPPIQKGTPPDVTNNYTITNTNTTNNYTSSSYSGTSPGPGPASGSSSSSSVSPGGTGSNSTGSGNSGKGGTDSTGKCANGSVPTASGCSGTYRDDGCDHPPACFGDAVLCGIAANTHRDACNPSSGMSVGSPSSALAAAGVPADGGASGDPSASGLVTSSDLGSDGFDSSGLGFSRSCPANPIFNVLGHSYTLDLTPFCNFAGMLGWFVLLIAYLAGLRIVATGKA